MQLDKIVVEARLRTPWEAIDLGILLAKQNWRLLFLSWAIPSLTLFLLLSLVPIIDSGLALLIVWWLKPLFDRLPLFALSRILFQEKVTLHDIRAHFFKTSKTDWFPWLSYRRFNPSRSFDMPVTVLEGLKGQARSKRLNNLKHHGSSAWFWLTIIGMLIEGCILFSIYALVILFIPEEITIDYFDVFFDTETAFNYIYNVLAVLSMSLFAPFYVTSGFCLYISRRIELESWDLEINFKHLVSLHENQHEKDVSQ